MVRRSRDYVRVLIRKPDAETIAKDRKLDLPALAVLEADGTLVRGMMPGGSVEKVREFLSK